MWVVCMSRGGSCMSVGHESHRFTSKWSRGAVKGLPAVQVKFMVPSAMCQIKLWSQISSSRGLTMYCWLYPSSDTIIYFHLSLDIYVLPPVFALILGVLKETFYLFLNSISDLQLLLFAIIVGQWWEMYLLKLSVIILKNCSHIFPPIREKLYVFLNIAV